MRTIIVEECGSTNIEARDREKYLHGDAIIALRQTAGRGQRGHVWESAAGENLTFSLILEPRFLPAARQFLLSEVAALAVADTLVLYGLDARIKWTNDIYVGDSKICGILLENDLSGSHISSTIAGIGLNVNQTQFPEWLPNPTSMALLEGRKFDIMEVFERFEVKFWERYGMLPEGNGRVLSGEKGEYSRSFSEENSGCGAERNKSTRKDTGGNPCGSGGESISRDYNALLYRLGQPAAYFIPGRKDIDPTSGLGSDNNGDDRNFSLRRGTEREIGTTVQGIIRGVEPTGELIVEIDGRLERFLFREIEFII